MSSPGSATSHTITISSRGVSYRRKSNELEVFMPRGGSSVVKIREVTTGEENRISQGMDEETESGDEIDEDESDDDDDNDNDNDEDISVYESSLSIQPVKYEYNFPEVGFLFYKLTQLVNKRFDAVSEKMREKFERDEKKYEAVRLGKTQIEIEKISSKLDLMLVERLREEGKETMGKENILASAAFLEWKQITKKENRSFKLKNLKLDLHREFFEYCDLELCEILREIHAWGNF